MLEILGIPWNVLGIKLTLAFS